MMTWQGRGSGINCGFVYFNMKPSPSQRPPSRCTQIQRAVRPGAVPREACVGAARWLAHVLWQRFEYLLSLEPSEAPLRSGGKPHFEVL